MGKATDSPHVLHRQPLATLVERADMIHHRRDDAALMPMEWMIVKDTNGGGLQNRQTESPPVSAISTLVGGATFLVIARRRLLEPVAMLWRLHWHWNSGIEKGRSGSTKNHCGPTWANSLSLQVTLAYKRYTRWVGRDCIFNLTRPVQRVADEALIDVLIRTRPSNPAIRPVQRCHPPRTTNEVRLLA